MKISNLAVATLPVVALLGFSGQAGATALVGTVTADYLYPNASTVFASSVLTVGSLFSCPGGSGSLCSPFATPATILASGLSITINQQAGSFYTPAAFNGLRFSGLTFDDGSTVTGFTLVTNLAGLTLSDVSSTSASIAYNGEGSSFQNAPYSITLNLITSGAVPEPATWGMMIAGMAVVGAAVRRRKVAVTFA